MKCETKIDGDPLEMVERDLERMALSHTRAMRRAASDLKAAWRQEIQGSGLGPRLARTVRSTAYPGGTTSINAAAMVWTKAPEIVAAHDQGVTIRSEDGFYLAIPLEAAGRGRFGRRMTPGEYEQRTGQRLRFVYRRGRSSLLVADDARISKRGQARRKGGKRRKDGVLSGAQTIPVFLLVPRVKMRKRTDLLPLAEEVTRGIPEMMMSWVDD